MKITEISKSKPVSDVDIGEVFSVKSSKGDGVDDPVSGLYMRVRPFGSDVLKDTICAIRLNNYEPYLIKNHILVNMVNAELIIK